MSSPSSEEEFNLEFDPLLAPEQIIDEHRPPQPSYQPNPEEIIPNNDITMDTSTVELPI